MDPAPASTSPADVIAKPSRTHRLKLLAVCIMFLGFGVYCIYDGFLKYPADNAKALADRMVNLPHSDLDILLNRSLGVVLPIAGVALLIRMFIRSRGQYRLAGDTVYVPGHPPIRLSSIIRIDKRRWDRKGIAQIAYQLGGQPEKTFMLDDFYYERTPTDQIMAQIEAYAKGDQPPPADKPAAAPAPAPVAAPAPKSPAPRLATPQARPSAPLTRPSATPASPPRPAAPKPPK